MPREGRLPWARCLGRHNSSRTAGTPATLQVQNPLQWHCTQGQTSRDNEPLSRGEEEDLSRASIEGDIVGDYESIILIAGQEAAATEGGAMAKGRKGAERGGGEGSEG